MKSDKRHGVAKVEPLTMVEGASMESPATKSFAEQEIAELAYQRWVDRGSPEGSPDEDWFEAERELQSRGRILRMAAAGGRT